VRPLHENLSQNQFALKEGGMPAKAGIQTGLENLDSRLRANDKESRV
jgi:phage tail tube protein FII